MVTRTVVQLQVALWVAILVLAAVPMVIPAQEAAPELEDDAIVEDSLQEFPPHPNPTGRVITPRNDQSAEQQLADERECYDWACDQTDWDPYAAYDELVDAGYAVALTREEMAEGLVILASDGAIVGSVAGEIVGDAETGAEIGAAIAVASEVARSHDLFQPDDPAGQRVVARFERNLRNWDRKFAACLLPKGYRVASP